MLQSSIERLIQQVTGIDSTIVGSNLIRSAINRCMKMQDIEDLAKYWQQLQQDPPTVQQLIETVIVPETWFFRDREPFEFLAHQFHHLRSSSRIHTDKQHDLLTERPFRILSLPCSTGEEPYSIAMALLRVGIASSQFQIDAFDISHRNIQQATTGIYSNCSFRNSSDQNIQKQFFNLIEQGYQLHDRVKQCVNFRVGNALQLAIPAASYDVIFCRNLLIYFDQTTRQAVIDRLRQLLKSSGILFVGHAETSLLMNAQWQGIRVPFTFAYRKTNGHTVMPQVKPATALHRPVALPSPPPIAKSLPCITSSPPPEIPIIQPLPDLEQARQAADRGDFPTAKQLCAETLKRSPLQPAVYILLGQIHQAQAQLSMAETCFSKALYLDAHDLNALIHLARLKQSRGDQTAADRLYQRIARIQANAPNPETQK